MLFAIGFRSDDVKFERREPLGADNIGLSFADPMVSRYHGRTVMRSNVRMSPVGP